MRLARRELWVRVPVKTKSLSEIGGAVVMNVVGVEKVENVVCVEKVGGSFYSRSSLTDRAEPALQNETSSNEK